jgi:hypothetical protein
MKIHTPKLMPALALGILSMAATAQALITNSADLPPAGVYLSTDIHQIYGGPALEFLLTLPAHAPIAAEVQRRGGGGPLGIGTPADEIETFGSTLTAMMDVRVGGSSISGGPQPIFASGPLGSVSTLVIGKVGNVTGDFDTEMLSLSLSGVSPLGPFMIRESPTLASLGHTKITDIGGGLYQIDSFFDVFTELSIDGGATWMPSNTGAGHMVLVPEPTSMSLLAAGFAGMMGFIRRRR